MAIVSDIVRQSKDIERVNLYLDGEFCCGISAIVLANNHIKIGTSIDELMLENLIFESEKDRAFNYGVAYISRYTPTSYLMKKKLLEKGYNKSICTYVINKLEEYGYLNDKEYAKCYILYNKEVKGAIRIKNDLLSKGLSPLIVDKALEEFLPTNNCLDVARKHRNNEDIFDIKYQAKLTRFLQYRGYEWSDIKSAIEDIKDERRI